MLDNITELLDLLKETALDHGLEFVDLTGRTGVKEHYKDVVQALNQFKSNSTIYSTIYYIAIVAAIALLIYTVYKLVKGDTTKRWLGLAVLGLSGIAAINFTLDKWSIQDYDALVLNETIAVQVEYMKSTEGHEHRNEKEFETYSDLIKIKLREPNLRLSPAGILMLKPEALATYYGNIYSIFHFDKLAVEKSSVDPNRAIYYYMNDKFREIHAKNTKPLIESASFTKNVITGMYLLCGLLIGFGLSKGSYSDKTYLILLVAGLGFVFAITPYLASRSADLKAPTSHYISQVEEVINATK